MNVVHIIVKEEAKLGVSTVASDGRGAEVVRVAETLRLIWSNYSAVLGQSWYYLKQKKQAGSNSVFLSPGRRRA